MEANLCKQGYSAVQEITETKCLKRTDLCFQDTQKPYLGRHSLRSHDSNFAWNAELKVGFLYEIDHKLLPPKSPIQLKSIRAVMVAEKNELNVSVRFPSTHALRTYFSENETGRSRYPVLDEQFVMGARLAKEVLIRQILPPEFHEHGRMESFWFVPPRVTEVSSSLVNGGDSMDETSVKGLCQTSLNCDGLLNWGVRRRITFKVKNGRVPSSSSLVKEEEDVQTVIRTTKEEVHKPNTRKRKREGLRRKKKPNVYKPEKKPPAIKTKRQKLKLSYDRWSQERYKSAEVKMLEIMKEKGAVIGKPMLRPDLRLEARKHIGDTGLLDHLLKHMAGKVAPNGEDRFRRRHNADGAMEYWLESADLVNVRKEAGVNDPYWTPPPGWKPGDSISQEANTALELNFLKEEMASIKRDVQELLMWKREDNGQKALPWRKEDDENKAIVALTKSSSENSNLEWDNKLVSTGEDYESLLKTKAELEQQLLQVSESLKGMQEGMRKCKRRVEREGGSTSIADGMVVETIGEKDRIDINEVEEENKVAGGGEEQEEKTASESAAAAAAAAKAAKKERLRSGFRICKPQGTFLWPSSSSAENNPDSGNVLSPHHQMLVQVESLVMVPTPPSVTSATTSAPHLFPPLPPTPTSPVKPLPEKRAVTNITFSSSTTTTFDSMSTTTTNASLHLHKDVNGFCGTPSPCTTYPRALLIPSTAMPVACIEANEAASYAMGSSSSSKMYQRKPTLHQHQHHSPDAYCGRSWLALATPNSSLASDSLYFN